MDLLTESDNQSLSVGDFMAAARRTVEAQFAPCWVAGEVANFVRAASGHWYFVLRDSAAQADCVMLRQYNALLPSPLADGDAVEVLAQPSIYAPRGRFQLLARFVRRTGDGRLHQLYARRKKEWAARGWFDSAAKRTPPFWPRVIGVVASASGAAARDVLRALKMRMPSIAVVLYPAPAQGADAAAKIAAAIRVANRRGECETLLVVRGGGGIEDLWAFNEEDAVAAIVESRLPIITGIGHEIDETLADFAADLRAPTPTAAAVLASPDRKELREQWRAAAADFHRAAARNFRDSAQRLDFAAAALSRPSLHLQRKNAALRHWAESFASAARLRLQTADSRIQNAAAVLRACAPQNTLARGYSIVRDAAGVIVRDGNALQSGDDLHLTFARGDARATVRGVGKSR